VQRIDVEAVIAIARERRLLVRLDRRPGDFVTAGATLATAWPADEIDPRARKRLEEAFVLGSQRTPAQDIRFGVQQLVEMAVRALSPSINDPFTAMSCIDRLGAALRRLAARTAAPPCRFDAEGTLRVIAEPVTFGEVAEGAFEPLRQAAAAQPAVAAHAACVLGALLGQVPHSEDGAALRRQLERIADGAARHAQAIEWQEVRAACERALHGPQARHYG
jgi:uncharacterized membrane protein